MRLATIVTLAALVAAAPAGAQSLAARIAAAPDGIVRIETASRAGVCGDGRDAVAWRSAYFDRHVQSYGHWTSERCVPGPLRLTLDVAGGAVTRVRTHVGGGWRDTDRRVTDLGTVDPAEASAFLFSLVSALDPSDAADRALLPAVLADAGSVVAPLAALARDGARTRHARSAAIVWLGLAGGEEAAPVLHGLIEDANEMTELRGSAIFALTLDDDTPPREFDYLRGIYARLPGERLKRAVHQAMVHDDAEGGRWLLARAADGEEPLELRKSALFWAGQRAATPTADLVHVYETARDRELREHAIFVLSQRQDAAATDALLAIARAGDDTAMRGKALFWLAQKDDPRVRQLIADLVLK